MEKNDFERLKSSSGKKRNAFVANPIIKIMMKQLLFSGFTFQTGKQTW